MAGLPGLSTRWLGRSWEHFGVLDSTNTYCKENAHRLAHGTAVTASHQTAGKGRRGKQWHEAPDSSLCLSVVLQDFFAGEMALLPLLVGLGVCEGVEALCGAACTLKWSNDVLIGGEKLCGILCESRLVGAGGYAVAGMGVNLTQTREDFTDLGLVYATSLLLATGKPYAAPAVAAAVLNGLEPVLEQYGQDGFSPLRDRYRERCVTLGRPVRILWEGREQEGLAVDIAENGALLCNIGGKLCPVTAGEASVRGLYGYA